MTLRFQCAVYKSIYLLTYLLSNISWSYNTAPVNSVNTMHMHHAHAPCTPCVWAAYSPAESHVIRVSDFKLEDGVWTGRVRINTSTATTAEWIAVCYDLQDTSWWWILQSSWRLCFYQMCAHPVYRMCAQVAPSGECVVKAHLTGCRLNPGAVCSWQPIPSGCHCCPA